MAAASSSGTSMPQTHHDETLTPAPMALPEEPDTTATDTAASSSPAVEKKDNEKDDGEDEDSSSIKTLERATELFNKGSKAIEDGDYVDAVDCLSRSLEIRVAHYGELAPECALSYYKYGCALLYKSQEEADPLGDVPKNDPRNEEKDSSSKSVGGTESSKASASNAKESLISSLADNDREDDNEDSDDDGDGNGDGEELAEGDEDDSDLDLAWKMLDVARAIVEKCPEDKIEKVNILSALGEVSMEREDFETSLNDYQKSLAILERLVEPDNRRIIELNFRICLVLEVWSKVEEAIPYCQKAISLCKSRLKKLSDDAELTTSPENPKSVNDSVIGANQDSRKGDADSSVEEDEKQVLSGILSELERKLEDLQHVMSNPRSILKEMMLKMVASKSATVESNPSFTESTSASLSSSRMGGVVGGGFDSPTVSTAATNGSSITHLGVVGRGVKRASLNPVVTEPSSKKPELDSSSEKEGGSISQVDSTVQDAETAEK